MYMSPATQATAWADKQPSNTSPLTEILLSNQSSNALNLDKEYTIN